MAHWYGQGRNGRSVEAWLSNDRFWCEGCGTSFDVPRACDAESFDEAAIEAVEQWTRDHFLYTHGVFELHSTNDDPILRQGRRELAAMREETRRLEIENERLRRSAEDDDDFWGLW